MAPARLSIEKRAKYVRLFSITQIATYGEKIVPEEFGDPD